MFLLDDHEVFRRGVRDLLAVEPDIDVVAEAGTAATALAQMRALHPHVAVLDVRLPDGDGVAVCREIRSGLPWTACLMLTAYDEALFDAVMAGAAGYVLNQIHGTDLVEAVRTVASGQSMLDPYASRQVMAQLPDENNNTGNLECCSTWAGSANWQLAINYTDPLGFKALSTNPLQGYICNSSYTGLPASDLSRDIWDLTNDYPAILAVLQSSGSLIDDSSLSIEQEFAAITGYRYHRIPGSFSTCGDNPEPALCEPPLP